MVSGLGPGFSWAQKWIGLNELSGGAAKCHRRKNETTHSQGNQAKQRDVAREEGYGPLGETMMPPPGNQQQACGSDKQYPTEEIEGAR